MSLTKVNFISPVNKDIYIKESAKDVAHLMMAKRGTGENKYEVEVTNRFGETINLDVRKVRTFEN